MSQLAADLRYALRRLVRTPVFSLGALAIMAIAIGANTAVFTVVNKLLLAPPPFEQPDRVVNVYQDSDDGEPSSSSFPAYRDVAALGDVFQSVGATTATSATLDVGDGTQTVDIEFTTASFLPTTGLDPTRGRWFDPTMDAVGAGNYAVVNHRTWQTRFGSDPSVVGRTLRLNGQPVTVIGVGPEGLNGIGNFIVTEFWLSISSVAVGGDFRVGNLDRREDHWYEIRARLADGVSIPQAQQATDALAQSLATEFPELNEGRDITVFASGDVRIHPEVDGNLLPVAGALMTIVILILILAATNLGGLLLVRGASRGPEVAVRRALGAEPGRVARLFLAEAMLLSLTGGLLGLVLARWLLDLLAAAPLPGPLGGELDLSWDVWVLLFGIALMVGTGGFFGLAPAFQSLKTDVAGTLREDDRSLGGRRRLSLMRNFMVAAQVAVSLILVVGAAVMVRSLTSYGGVDPGVDAEQLAFLQTDFGQVGITAAERAPVLRTLQERIASIPGVTDVALTTRLPMQGGGTTTTTIEEYEPPSGTGSVELNWALVSPGYFGTVGIRVLQGRGYAPEDQTGDQAIVIVNETAASTFWPGQDPLGRRIRPQSDPDGWIRVIGVVADSKIRSLSEPPTPILYYLMGPSGVNAPYILARSAANSELALAGMRTELNTVNAGLPVIRLSTLESHMGDALAAPRLSAGLLSLFSLLALCLASVGVYAIVSYSVSGRTREVGIRVALGAERARVVWMVIREVATTVCLGLAAGAAVVVFLSPFVQNLLFGTEVLSFGTFGVAVLILGGAVGVASFLPAWRAAGVDPAEALRGS